MRKDLIKAARVAQKRAYAPYSRFKVGAAILADDGQIYSGCNVENAAYPEGVCAETSAISAMTLAGGRRIREIAVIGGDGKSPVAPCGGCRQRIREFADAKTAIILMQAGSKTTTYGLKDLLPESFGPSNLRKR